MKILVCIKQVPDMESRFRVNDAGNWYAEVDLAWRMNEYDEFAVEEAVRTKEQLGGETELTVLSIGPERIRETLKKALAMGCDRAVQITDEHASQKDPFEIAAIIAAYARGQDYQLIFTGMQSQDRGSAQVGVLVAEMLQLPSLTTIVDFSFSAGKIVAKRELEGGSKTLLEASPPALITCQLGLNTPRYPTLPNIMKAKKKELQQIAVAELHKVSSKQETRKAYPPEKSGSGQILEGDSNDLADQLIAILKEKTGVLA